MNGVSVSFRVLSFWVTGDEQKKIVYDQTYDRTLVEPLVNDSQICTECSNYLNLTEIRRNLAEPGRTFTTK